MHIPTATQASLDINSKPTVVNTTIQYLNEVHNLSNDLSQSQ